MIDYEYKYLKYKKKYLELVNKGGGKKNKSKKAAKAKRATDAKRAADAKRIADADAKRVADARQAAEEKIYQDFNDSLKESGKKIEKDMLEVQAIRKAKKRSKKAKKRRKKGVDVEDDPNILTQEILYADYNKFLEDLETEELANSKKE